MPKDDKQRSLEVLGLVRNASKNDIRLAFFKKALFTHPDLSKNNSENMANFSEVTQAYSNLSDGSGHDSSSTDEVFFKFFQEVLKDDSAQSLRAMLQEHDAAKCADDEYRVDEDDNEIDIEREFERLLEILKNRRRKGKEVPEDITQDKVTKCRDNLVRQREEAKKDPKKQAPKKGKQTQQVPVSKPKPKSKKQLLAEQRRRDKEMEKIAVELDKKKKEDEVKEKIRKQMEAEKQKRLEEERKKTEAEARRQREREQKERERLQKLEQERERKQKEEEERKKKEEIKRKKAEQDRIEKDKAEKAAKKAAQQAAKEKEEQAKNSNKNQNLKRNPPQRNDQTYPREIPPRFQRRMKQQQQQQQQTVFPQQIPSTSVPPIAPVQPQASAQNLQPAQTKAAPKPTQTTTVGKKKDPQRWTKGEYTGIIEDKDDSAWSNAPPAKTSENWEETTDDWGNEGKSWEEKPISDERVIVDKTDQDSWPTVGVKANSREEISGNIDAVSEKEGMSTFGDSLDAVFDGMEAAEEAAGTGILTSGKWNPESSEKDSGIGSSSNSSQDFDKGQTWSKTPGKDVKLKENTANNTDSLSNSWEESASGWKEGTSGWKEGTSGWNEGSSGLTTSVLKQNNSGWQEQPDVSDKWKAVGNPGSKTETAPNEDTGWGESAANKRNSGNNWGASWSAQGLSLTGTEIWDQSSADVTGDKGSDWTSEDSKGNTETGWDSVGQTGDENGSEWNSWSTAGSKRNKAPKPNPGNDENAWLRRSLKQLVDMGFKEVDGEKALRSNNMSLEAAISQLLGSQGTPPTNQTPMGTTLPGELVSEATGSTQTDEQDISKLNRKQRRRLMQQNLGSDVQETYSEPVTEPSEAAGVNVNMPASSAAVSEVSRVPVSSEPLDYGNEASVTIQNEQLPVNSDRSNSGGNTGSVAASMPGSEPTSETVAGSGSTTISGSMPNPGPVRPPLPAMYQQQLLQQQAQLQQLHLAQATGLLRNPLASQPVILLRQLSQLRLVQQQIAAQQQLLQKQPQPNTIQAQQLVLQQQQIAAMMQQIQTQLLQQQQQQQLQQQQQSQQQQLGSNQFPTPTQQTLLAAQPQQLQQLLLQQRKQQQQIPQASKQTSLQPALRTNELGTSSTGVQDSSDVQSISPRTAITKEPTSLVQVVNSAPASPSTGKSRLGQWTQNSIQTERLSPKLPESGGRDRNLRSSPQPDSSEKSSFLVKRSTNSPNSIQTTSNSAPVHRVLDPVSSKWGIDAAPKLSAEPPEFKPGVPWRPHPSKTTTDIAQSESFTGTAKTVSQEWPGSTIGSQTSYVNNNTKTEVTPLRNAPSSQNYSQNNSSTIWQVPQVPVARQPSVQRSTPLASNIRPPPGLGDENSFLNLPDVQSQSRDSNWSSHSESQMTSANQFGIRAPGFPSWPGERRDPGWPGTSGQPLDSLPSVSRTNELRNLALLEDSATDGNGASMRLKHEMPGQQSAYHALSTWLVIRNISQRVDSAALRSLCQQHGPLLTFQLNLRYGNSLIRYGHKEEAAKAHASLNGLVLAGSRLTADFATDSDIGSFFEQNSDWSASQPTTTWANAPTSLAKTEPSTQWPGTKPLFPPGNFSSELWSYSQAGGLAGGVWSAPPTSRRDGEQSTTVTENGITSPSMVTFLPPGLLNSGEST